MAKQTSFNLEDAEALLSQLQQFRETLDKEWSTVLNQWENLKATWRDKQFDRFEPLFEKLSATYEAAKLECEIYIGFLHNQIEVGKKRRMNLGVLEKPIAAIQIGMSLFGIAASPPTQNPAAVNSQPSSSYVQQKQPNSCSIDDKIEPEKLPEVQRYQSMTGIARVMKAEDQLSEAYPQEQERETERRKKEAETSAIANNQQPKSSGSPPS